MDHISSLNIRHWHFISKKETTFLWFEPVLFVLQLDAQNDHAIEDWVGKRVHSTSALLYKLFFAVTGYLIVNFL